MIAGRSFDEDVGYHSAARNAEVLAELEAQAGRTDRSAEQMQAIYPQFTQQLAKCGTLALRGETVEGGGARLVYEVTDAFGGPGGELFVEMVDEDGWKIRSDELKINAN